MSVAEAARRLGVSRDTVERRIRAGGLRAVRLAGRVLIPAAEVDRLLADGARR
ncbi:MAG: excisionase family DNA-binding protein [Chloroflexi bacterium]|nr:excisionase family DNA-binding protein [Chloroflexota bacterium]